MIARAKVVVLMGGPPIENGAVAVLDERIVDVGKFSEISKAYWKEEVVDLGEQVLLPGLINAHCHLDYTWLRHKISRQKSFTNWIREINAEKAKLSPEDYVRSINEGFAETKRFGTTTVANLTAFPELVLRINAPIRTWWFAELIDVRDSTRAGEIVDRAVDQLKSEEHWGLAPHALFTASASLYRKCAAVAPLLTTHLAESQEEMAMFREARGELYEFLKEIGREISDCNGETPVERFLQAMEGNHPCMLVHLNELAETDFELLARTGKNCSIVHCPRSHEYFGHSPFHFEKLRDIRLNICLGTDSLASNDDLSLFAEMRALQKEFPNLLPEEILKMVTTNAALALRQENELGKIHVGFVADLIAIPISKSTGIFEEIVAFSQAVNWSMLRGRVLP